MMEPAPSKEQIDNLILVNTEMREKLLKEMRKNLATIEKLASGLPVETIIERLEIKQLDRALEKGFDFESFPILRDKLNKNTARGYPFYERYVGWTTEDLFRNIYKKISFLKSILNNEPSIENVNLHARLLNVRKLMNLLLFHLDKKRTKYLCDEIKKQFLLIPTITFSEDVIVDDTFIADFSIELESGSNAFLEILDWESSSENIERAIKLLNLYKSTSNTQNGFVMLAGTYKSDFEKGLVSKDDLPAFIEYLLKSAPSEKQSHKPAPEKRVFVAMPFDEPYYDTWVNVIQPVTVKVGARAVRVDKEKYAGNIVSKIKEEISQAGAIVADLSESNPNVLFELGFADGNSIPFLQISSTPLESLPFDVRQNYTIKYTVGAVSKIEQEFEDRLRTII